MNANLPDDERYMRMALAEAKQAFEKGEVPVGCVIVANGQIEKGGINLVKVYKHKNPLWILNAP